MTYDAFLDAVQDRLSVDDRDEAADIATVVLETFSEILYRTERDKLTAPLPKPLKRPLQAPRPESSRREIKRLNAAAFLDRIQARADLNQEEAETATRVVLTVLREAVGTSLLSDLGRKLPASYAELFPFVPQSDSPGPASA